MKVKVIKYHPYPKDDPEGYTVGFDITFSNGRSFYIDTLLPFGEIGNNTVDEQIVDLALKKLKTKIEEREAQLAQTKTIVGSETQIQDEPSPEIVE